MKTLSVTFVLIGATSVALASNWVQIAKYANGTEVLADAASISSSGPYRKGWFKFVSLQASDVPDGAVPNPQAPPGQKFTYTLELFYAKCAERSAALIQGAFYGADDSLLATLPVTPVKGATFEESPPGSAGEKVINSLCKAK